MSQLLSFAQRVGQFQSVKVGTLLWLRKSKANKAGTAPIYLRVFVGAERIEHSCSIRVAPEQWDAPNGRILGKGKLVQQQNEQLQLLKAHVPELVNLMKATGRKVTINSLRGELIAPTVGKSPCFLAVCRAASALRDKLNPAAAQRAHFALKALADWRGADRTGEPRSLPIEGFTLKLAAEFYGWLLQVRGVKVSTANVMIGNLAGLFKYAAELGEVELSDNPFRALRKQKPAAPAPRLHLTLAQLATLRGAELPRREALARDIYLAQYYLHGSRVGAVLKLRWQDVTGDAVHFQAEKGGPQKTVALSAPLAQILARYRPATSNQVGLVFPLLGAGFFELPADAQHKARKQAGNLLNHWLKLAAARLGIVGNLHTHTARHTLAAHAAQLGGLEVAQGMLGHSAAAMTAHYAGPLHNPALEAVERALYGGDEPTATPEGGKALTMWKGGLVA
jgi:integrase/recombinase XerD